MPEHKYNTTVNSVGEWAKSELEHVGRIAAIEDKDIQYSYALSTVNGMAHLRKALFQMVNSPEYKYCKGDLLKTHNSVIRVMKQLIKDYKVNLETIKTFNVRHVLGDFSFLKNGTRKARK